MKEEKKEEEEAERGEKEEAVSLPPTRRDYTVVGTGCAGGREGEEREESGWSVWRVE